MAEENREALPKLEGETLSQDQAVDLMNDLIGNEPEIIIQSADHVMKTKFIGRPQESDSEYTFIIEPLDPDYSKDVLGDKSKVLFAGHYFSDDKQVAISAYASIDRFIIYNGYPALVLRLIVPLHRIIKDLIVFPAGDNAPNLKIPIEGMPSDVQVMQMEKDKVICSLAGGD